MRVGTEANTTEVPNARKPHVRVCMGGHRAIYVPSMTVYQGGKVLLNTVKAAWGYLKSLLGK